MARDKYHAQMDFKHTGGGGSPRILRFTAVDLDRLLDRFVAEVRKRQEENRANNHYVWVQPNLTVEVCGSWSEFDQYEH